MVLLTKTKQDLLSLDLDNKKTLIIMTYSLTRITSIQMFIALVVVYDLQTF